MRRLLPLQRGYFLSYRRAKAQMRCELDAMAQHLDDELAELDDRRAAHRQTVQQIGDEFAELMAEMEGMKNEYRRWQAVEKAIAVERTDELLN